MTAVSDAFIVGTFAMWAGDTAYFESLETTLGFNGAAWFSDVEARSPEDIMRGVYLQRLMQLRRRRQALKAMLPYDRNLEGALEAPAVLRTRHLRGVLWRLSEREFALRAYPVDLTWDRELFARARRQEHQQALRPESTSSSPSVKGDQRSYSSRGAAWVVPGDLFVQMAVTGLGLIEGTGLWTSVRLEVKDGEAVRRVFQSTLESLDEH